MLQDLAYVVGARLVVPSAVGPKSEYMEFVARNRCAVLDYATIDSNGGPSARSLKRRGMPHIGLGLVAAAMHREYAGFVVSAEDVGLPLILAARLRGARTPVFMITHGSYFRSWKFRWLMRLVRRLPNVHFLCLAESLRTTLTTRFGVSSAAHNTGYGVDTEFFQPRRPSQRPLIASAGTATRDYKTLVAAVDGLNVDVRIAADSAWFPVAVDIKDQKLPSNVEARSYGDYVGLRDLYASSSFVVVPLYPAPYACGFAVIIEAMAMGKAVIATGIEATTDYLVEGETGFYVPPNDPAALRERIQFLLDRPELAAEMGRTARCLIEEKYSLEAYCGRMESVVQMSRAGSRNAPEKVAGTAP